jgi:hypothetical protein
MVHYLDEARSIDARRVMSAALKSGRREGYDRTFEWPDPVCRDQGAFLHPTLTIDVQWPASATDPVHGTVLIRYPDLDGRVIEQTLELQGTPARVGGWQWQFSCPDTKRQVRTLYLAPDGKRFQSREAAQLKSRRLSKVERHQRNYYQLVCKLQTGQWAPVIAKPANMTERIYHKLCNELEHAHIRLLCAVLGRPEPEFWDTEPKRAKPKSSYRSRPEPRSTSACKSLSKSPSRSAARNAARARYFRGKSGALQLRSNLKKSAIRSAVPQSPMTAQPRAKEQESCSQRTRVRSKMERY